MEEEFNESLAMLCHVPELGKGSERGCRTAWSEIHPCLKILIWCSGSHVSLVSIDTDENQPQAGGGVGWSLQQVF